MPPEVRVTCEFSLNNAQIDVIVPGYGSHELTNATIKNYLSYEKETPINIIAVESSGNPKVFEKIVRHERVSRVLIHNFRPFLEAYKLVWGMSISSAVGQYYSTSPYVFFSHNDMLACKENFLTFLLSKMSSQVRLASFSQRHVIPFTGGMLVNRSLLIEPGLDWGIYKSNPFIVQAESLAKIDQPKHITNFDWIDCGESFVYSELEKNNSVYVCASRGGTNDFWRDPFDYFSISAQEAAQLVKNSGCPIIYAPLNISREDFVKKYPNFIKADQAWNWDFRNKRFWRCSFDDKGDLLFIHHGRGTSLGHLKNWLKLVQG
jgi:hypothetical protein